MRVLAAVVSSVLTAGAALAQAPTDATAPLLRMKPDYPIPYGSTTPEAVTEVLRRVLGFVEASTPLGAIPPPPGAFRLTSYEWGVTYSGMLRAGEATGDPRFAQYVSSRLAAVDAWARQAQASPPADPAQLGSIRQVLKPAALDDSGAMSAAMIKATRAGVAKDLRPRIDNYLDWISNKEFRLSDGTLARNRPQPNTLWLDDLYMGVPALAQMGALTGDRKYFDDAVKQVRQFSARMFNPDLGLYMHGWVQDMEPHPEFRWARANGWAILAMTELLDVLPEDHPGRASVLAQYRAHAKGLAARQGASGLWHQLLDRSDSYLETSATAMYTYAMARGVNKGWLDPVAYGPAALLGWQAVTTKVNAQGQVEGTCVGTGMGFDPAFYYHRPTHVFAAHGYGPVLLAGGEVIDLVKKYRVDFNDSSVQFYRK
ncbi:MAG TPA: glycoside hydrolase family 88 protein [Vicinamibacteria bacterium]|nr:glycoside hydrolase family 88 protein [Vicinamibacteria bacterium]